MSGRSSAGRWLGVLVIVALIVQAGVSAPAPALAEEPSSSPPAEQPIAPPTPEPTHTPPPADEPPLVDGDATAPGTERVDLRTAYSKTYEQSDGTFVSEFFTDAVHYRPEGTTDWQPINLTLDAATTDGAAAEVAASPVDLSLHPADADDGFLRITGAGHSISLGLPVAAATDGAESAATIKEEGLFADYADFLPGGIGLRVFPRADGFKSFLVLPTKPESNEFSFRIDAPGLSIAHDPEQEGALVLTDEMGALVANLPRPFLLDSSELEGRGGGLYAEAVSQKVSADGEGWLLTLTVEPSFLESAVYPVYVDPTVYNFPNGTGTTANDTFASSKYPTSNFNQYQRPDSPYYHEMWHGNEPGTSYYNEVYIRFNDLAETMGSGLIEDVSFQFMPYWQYNHSDWKSSWVERIADDWGAGTLTWNARPGTDLDYGEFTSKEDVWTDWDLTDYVQDVVNGTHANHGFMFHAESLGQGGWKRIISSNNANQKPKLEVTWSAFAAPSVAYPAGAGETSSRTLNWLLPEAATQSALQVQVDTESGFNTPLTYDSSTVTSSAPCHMIPTATTLTEGATYYWRVKVKYGVNTAFSSWSNTGSFTYRQGGTLGLPGHNTFEPFILGNADTASVNITTGNLVVSHPIVSLPIRGGSLDLGLTYNSQALANAGTGPGWRLNATRRLTELGNGDVVFTAGDGSVHTFTKISTQGGVTTYTRPATVYATLTKDTAWTNEWKLVYRDQSVDEFNLSGTEGLLAKQADRHGNAVTFAYYSGTNRLQTATDPAGRVVDFAWNTGVSPARLTSITDWAYVSSGVVQTTNTGSRREYRLFYDGNGYLIGWSNPINTSGSCPTMASNLTCLTYTSGLLSAVTKRQTYATFSGGTLGTSTRDISTQIIWRGGEVAEVRDAEQANAGTTGTTFTRIAADQLQVVRQGTPASTTTYGFVATTDQYGRVASVWRKLGATDIEQRTTWNGTYPIERASVTDNYGASPARTVSYTYVGSSPGLVDVVTEPLTGSTNRTTSYTYNSNNDVTQLVVAGPGGSTTTRYCYTTSGCSTSAYDLTLKSAIENYVDGSKGGSGGNATDVTTDYQYDGNGQLTLETRWNYDEDGNLLDSRSTGYEYDSNGNQFKVIANFDDGDTNDAYDAAPDPSTGARTDLTSVFTFDTAGNQVSSTDPRRALMANPGADDYVTRSEYDTLNQQTKSTAPRDPADASAPKATTSVYDELGALRQATDFGGLVSATEYDRAGRPIRTFEDVDGAGGTAAQTTNSSTFDAAGRLLSTKNRNQVGDADLGAASTTYDELGRATEVVDASGSSPDVSSTTEFAYDALDRQISTTVGGMQTTSTAYDLGGRTIEVDDGFACTQTTFDYRDLALTETSGLVGASCASGSETATVEHTYDALGRRTRTDVTAGPDDGDRPFDAALDSAGRNLRSVTVKQTGQFQVMTVISYTYNPLDQLIASERGFSGHFSATTKFNFDPAGNGTDRCFWTWNVDVGDCFAEGHTPWTDPPTQVTSSTYDARDNVIELRDSESGTTTTYDADHNYQIKALYVATGSGREHQSQYGYDARHRLVSIDHQLCVLDTGTPAAHDCSSTTATGFDDYAYDDNDNRTTVSESNGSASSDRRYCYDALNRLTYRNTGAACSSSAKDEAYTFDDAGNRLSALVGGQSTNYAYNGDGQLCKVGGTSCGTPNVTYDTAGRTETLSGWFFEYDAEGRLTTACESTSCAGSIDKVEFFYDGEGHRTRILEYVAGTLTTTRDFRYQGDAIVEESTNGSVSRGFAVDDAGRIVRFCDPSCANPAASYLVTWNGHGDALAAWRINDDGTLTLANSYTYSSWGAPTTAAHNGISDLGFRFLYVGAYDVQWDDFSGLGLHYMHARHYSPAIGRFLQPDPSSTETNHYSYARANPATTIDPAGLEGMNANEVRKCNANPRHCYLWWQATFWAEFFSFNRYPLGAGGRRGAMRHCIWQCLLTVYISRSEAWWWGLWHELDSEHSLWSLWGDVRSRRDLLNNEVGRAIAGQMMRQEGWRRWVPGAVESGADRWCFRALATGRLALVDNGRLVPSSP